MATIVIVRTRLRRWDEFDSCDRLQRVDVGDGD